MVDFSVVAVRGAGIPVCRCNLTWINFFQFHIRIKDRKVDWLRRTCKY